MDTIADRIPRYEQPMDDWTELPVVDACETCRHRVCARVERMERRLPPRRVTHVVVMCAAAHDRDGEEWLDVLTEPVEECSEWEMVDE